MSLLLLLHMDFQMFFFLFYREINDFDESQQIDKDCLDQMTKDILSIGQEDSPDRLATQTTTIITTQAISHKDTLKPFPTCICVINELVSSLFLECYYQLLCLSCSSDLTIFSRKNQLGYRKKKHNERSLKCLIILSI